MIKHEKWGLANIFCVKRLCMRILATEAQFSLVRMTAEAGHLPFSYTSEARPAVARLKFTSHRWDFQNH